MGRARDLLGVADLDDFSAIHYGDAGGEVAHHRHGVRDEEVGEAEVALELGQQVDDLGADADVEGGDGLVADDEFRAEREGAGDSDALALASGEFVGIAERADSSRPTARRSSVTRRSSCARPDSRGRLSHIKRFPTGSCGVSTLNLP